MDLPFVTCIRAKEFKFRPITDDLEDTHAVDIGRPEGHERLRSRMNKPSVWNRDGEVIHEPNIHLKYEKNNGGNPLFVIVFKFTTSIKMFLFLISLTC